MAATPAEHPLAPIDVSRLRVTTHSDPKAFSLLASPLLLRDEATHCLGLGILDTLVNEPGRYPRSLLLAVHVDACLNGIAWMTPPHPLGLSVMPRAAVEALVEHAALLEAGISSVVGPKPTVDEFKDRWLERRRCSLQKTIEQRIYRLDEVIVEARAPGSMRVATKADATLVTEWSRAFVADCGLGDSEESVRGAVSAALQRGCRVLWEVAAEPVSMAGFGGQTPSGIRISWVYTPPQRRGHGYASALVAALSDRLLAEGRNCCFLYTDLANPTSNRIYQRIGYRPVGDSAHHVFAA